MSPRLHYDAMTLIRSSQPSWTTEVNKVPRLQPEKAICRKPFFDSGYKTMLRPGQKSVNVLQDILGRFRKPG